MQTSLSIIIPTKNEEAYLPRLLQSIKIQTFQKIEVIVADANSHDRTREIAKKYGCTIVQGGNHPSIGRNKGAAVAQSPLLLFLDADVLLPDKEFLAKTLKEFSARNLAVACCRTMITKGKPIDHFGVAFANLYFIATERFIKHGVGFCTFIRKQIHEQIGGYDEKLVVGEDFDYVIRASKVGEFRFLRSKKIIISLRRYELEGRIKLFLKYIYTTVSLLFSAKVVGKRISYTFDHNYSEKDK